MTEHRIMSGKVKLHIFLTAVLDGGEWLASCCSCFILRESHMYLLDRKLGRF